MALRKFGPADQDAAEEGRREPPDRRGLSGRETGAIALLVFLGHLALALLVPMPGSFGKYPEAARQLASGEMPRERLIDFSPLYLELHRLGLPFEPLFGKLETCLPYFQIALLGWAVAAAAAAASRHLGRAAAAIFALLLAADRHLVVYARVLEPEILLLALLATWLFFLDRAPSRLRHLLLAGLAAALAVATRPTFLPVFLVVVPLFLGFQGGFRPARLWLRRSALFLLPLLIAVALLAWRAAAATGDPFAPAMNPGTVFFEGHQPLSTGTSARYPPAVHLAVRADGNRQPDVAHAVYRQIARVESGDPALPIGRVNDFWASRALAFVRDQSMLAASRAVTQLRYALHAYFFHDVSLAKLYEQRLPGVFLPFSLLAAAAVWGAAAHARRLGNLLPYYAILAAQLGVMTLFYVSARQRLVLLPAIVFFALLGVRDLRERGRRGLLVSLLLAFLALAFSVRDPAQNEDRYAGISFSSSMAWREEITRRLAAGEGLVALREELCASVAELPARLEDLRPADFPQDEESLESCVARHLRRKGQKLGGWPRTSSEFDLGAIELLLGHLDAAEALLRPLAEAGLRFPRDGAEPSSPSFYLGRIAFLRGDPAAARRELEAALAAAPGEPFVLADLAALTGEAQYRELLLRYYSRLDLAWIHGRALLFYRQPEAAARELAGVADRWPGVRRPRLELAVALAELNRDSEALAQLKLAYQGAGEPYAEARRLAPLFERLAGRAVTAGERAEVGILFFHHGAYRRAAELLAPAIAELGPASPPQLAQMLEIARRPRQMDENPAF